jgi:hypothetical protein
MHRWASALFVALTVLACATPAKAQSCDECDSWFSRFCDNFKRDCKRNQYWPEPFLYADRKAVIAPFGQMVANGWRRQNLISDYHFREDSPQLTLAGEEKLRYILTQMPPSRRTVFVQQGLSSDITAARINSVHRAALHIVPAGVTPDVVETDLPNDGWPADDIDAVARRWSATRPDPRLESIQSSDGSDGGGETGQ